MGLQVLEVRCSASLAAGNERRPAAPGPHLPSSLQVTHVACHSRHPHRAGSRIQPDACMRPGTLPPAGRSKERSAAVDGSGRPMICDGPRTVKCVILRRGHIPLDALRVALVLAPTKVHNGLGGQGADFWLSCLRLFASSVAANGLHLPL